ncbi:MAG: sulfur carrier protein ThiS [Bacteroidales bacterium]
MEIYINNVARNIECEITIEKLLSAMDNIPTTGVAIAVNGSVVGASRWSEHKLNDGDKVTIIRAFYGG